MAYALQAPVKVPPLEEYQKMSAQDKPVRVDFTRVESPMRKKRTKNPE
jgi:hypothetical protein